MAADHISNHGLGWARWLQEQLDERRWAPVDLVRCAQGRIASSQVSRWLKGDRVPDPDSVRPVCDVIGAPVLEGMLAAGHLHPEDLRGPRGGPLGSIRIVTAATDTTHLTKRALLAELDRRLPADEQVTPADDDPAPPTIRSIPGPQADPKGEGVRWAARRRPHHQ